MRCANGYNMPLQVVEAVASSGRYTRTHAVPTGYTCTPKRRKSLIYKHSIIILIFQGTQRKAYKNMLNACGWNRANQTTASQKGRNLCAPCI